MNALIGTIPTVYAPAGNLHNRDGVINGRQLA
jgi:hypothetical protein